MGLLDRLSGLLGGDDGGDADDAEGATGDGEGDAGDAVVDDLFDASPDDRPGEPPGSAGTDAAAGDTSAGSAGDASAEDADGLGPADFREEAESFAEDHGDDYRLDFTVASLSALDEYADGQGAVMGSLAAEMAEGDVLEQLQGGYTLWTGSYLGEVLVREFGGEWADAEGWAVEIPVDGGALEVPVFDVAAESMAEEPLFAAVGEEVADGVESAAAADEAGAAAGEADTDRAAPAEELAAFWSEHDLDFTPGSLARLDELVDDQWEKERFRDAELGGDEHMDDLTFTGLVEQLGSYYGEVLVRTLPAAWTESEAFGTAVEVDGAGEEAAVVNVYHVASDCLTEPSKFAPSFDTVVDQLDLDHERVSEDAHVVAAERDDAGAAERDDTGATERDEWNQDAGAEAKTGARAEAVEPADAEEVVEGFAEDAEALVERYPERGLDYSPDSLERLDRLVAEEFEGHDFSDVELGSDEDGDSLFLTAQAMEAGGYLAAVLERHLGGEWRDEDDLYVAVEGRDAEARLDPVAVAADVYRGEDSFAATYEALRGRLSVPEDAGEGDLPAGADADVGEDGDGSAPDDPAPDDPAPDQQVAPDDPDPDEHDAADDPTLERYAARAAAETAAEQQATPASEEVAERHRAAAEGLVADWPAYDLDNSVESLVRLDALVAAEFDRSGGDREYEGDPLSVPEGAQLSIPTDGSVTAFAGYLAELFRRHHDAAWTVADGDPVLAVAGPAGEETFDPAMVAVACFAGESSFVDAYATVAAEAGLEPPLER